eukprot:1158895-Pelagomonas_calceolata.AAC.13
MSAIGFMSKQSSHKLSEYIYSHPGTSEDDPRRIQLPVHGPRRQGFVGCPYEGWISTDANHCVAGEQLCGSSNGEL